MPRGRPKKNDGEKSAEPPKKVGRPRKQKVEVKTEVFELQQDGFQILGAADLEGFDFGDIDALELEELEDLHGVKQDASLAAFFNSKNLCSYKFSSMKIFTEIRITSFPHLESIRALQAFGSYSLFVDRS